MRAVLLPLLALSLAGCAAPGGPLGPPWGDCPAIPKANVTLLVAGLPPLLGADVYREPQHGILRTCAGRSWFGHVPATAPHRAEGLVDAQMYGELRLTSEQGVVRAKAALNLTEDGVLEAHLGREEVGLAWRGAPLRVERVERHADAERLAAYRENWEREPVANGTRWFNFTVNTSWNRGVEAVFHLTLAEPWLRGVDIDRLREDASVPRGTLTVRLLAPNGSEERRERVATPYEAGSLWSGPLEPGNLERGGHRSRRTGGARGHRRRRGRAVLLLDACGGGGRCAAKGYEGYPPCPPWRLEACCASSCPGSRSD